MPRDEKVTAVLAIRVGYEGEGGSAPGEPTPMRRGSPITAESRLEE